MNSKWHFYVSTAKSLIRMMGCVWLMLTGNMIAFALAFMVAELLGIIEEVGDER